jgi:hypothetical protein
MSLGCKGVINGTRVGMEVTEAQRKIQIRDSMNQREMTSLQLLARRGSLTIPLTTESMWL